MLANFLKMSTPSLMVMADTMWGSWDKCPKILNSICSKSAARNLKPWVGLMGDLRLMVLLPTSRSPFRIACRREKLR